MCLCCTDGRHFDTATASSFTNYSWPSIKIGSHNRNLNVKDLLSHTTTISHNMQKEAEKLHKSLIPSTQCLTDLQ
jgi:hypothetical protein